MRTHNAIRRVSTTLVTAATGLVVVFGTATAASADSLGVDVSSWNHVRHLNWAKVRADGNRFAFIKATEGSSYVNPYFRRDWAGTARVGLYHGAYHFATPRRGNARAQARFFVRVAGRMHHRGSLPPVLDLEDSGGLRPAALRRWTRTWLETVHHVTGRKPILYTYPRFWRTALGNTRALSGYSLWIAHYGVRRPQLPGGWHRWTFWQGTSTARVSGIRGSVDRDAFNGSLRRLRRLAHAVRRHHRAATRISLHRSRTRIDPGGRVRLSGRLRAVAGKLARGRRVSIVRNTGSGWKRVRSTRVGPAGGFSVAVHPRVPSRYQARFHRGRRYRAAWSPVRTVRVRGTATSVSLHAGSSTITRGHRVRLYGHLTTASGRPLPGQPVKFFRRPADGSTWHPVTTVSSVAPTGWFQTYVRPRRDQVYRAVFPGTPRHRHGGSTRVWVSVRPE